MNLKIPPLALTGILIVFMSVLSWLSPQFTLSIPKNNIVALFFAIVGGSICIMGVASFRSVQTTINPTKPNQASSLVVNGIYRISRNPMYLGFLLLLIAWGIFLTHSLSLLLLPPVFVLYMNKFQIPLEEKALGIKFGEDFIAYKNIVRRWL